MIRPHRPHAVVDAAQVSLVACLCICVLSSTLNCAKTAEPTETPFWDVNSCWVKKPPGSVRDFPTSGCTFETNETAVYQITFDTC